MTAVAADLTQARMVKNQLVERLAGVTEVNGVGLIRSGDGWAVKVNLERPVPGWALPAVIDGVTVVIDVVGPINAR